MKKSIAIVLVLLMLLSLIACNKDVSDTEKQGNTVQDETEKSSDESSIHVSVKYRNLECSAYQIGGTYPIITFSEEYQEKYPEIWKDISAFNEIWCNTVETYLSEFALYQEGIVETKVPRREIIAWFSRFDDALITLEITDSGEEFRHTIINYDTKTQHKLSLEDVFYDFDLGLIKEEYQYDNNDAYRDYLATFYECENEEKQEFAIKELQKLTGTVTLSNPSWDYYVADGQRAACNHIALKKISEVWPDESDIRIWADTHGFTIASPQYEDDNYIYYPVKYSDNNYYYYYSELRIYSKTEKKIVYAYNLEDLCNGPDLIFGKTSDTRQYLNYAKIIDNILYMAIGFGGYSAEEPKSKYLVAVDLNTNEILFKTEPLTINSKNFLIIEDTIICGHGFTEETDWIYLLDRYTGERIDSIPVDSMVEQFGEKDGVLYVITYNMLYEFKIVK